MGDFQLYSEHFDYDIVRLWILFNLLFLQTPILAYRCSVHVAVGVGIHLPAGPHQLHPDNGWAVTHTAHECKWVEWEFSDPVALTHTA